MQVAAFAAVLIAALLSGCATCPLASNGSVPQECSPCQQSDWEACARCAAAMTASGRLVPSIRPHRAACDAGVPSSCGALGRTLLKIRAWPPPAVALLRRACDSDPASEYCVDLAVVLMSGAPGVVPSPADATHVARTACDAGQARACELQGGPRSAGDTSLCAPGRAHWDSCLASAMVHLQGHGRPTDPRLAVAILEPLCGEGFALGCFFLGAAYGDVGRPPLNEALALRAYMRGCELGDGKSCSGGAAIAKDRAVARRLIERGCALREPLACFGLAAAMLAGLGGQSDATQARPLLEAACTAGIAPACTLLAQRLVTGDGMSVEPDKAVRVARQACETLGDADACHVLARILSEGGRIPCNANEASKYRQYGDDLETLQRQEAQ